MTFNATTSLMPHQEPAVAKLLPSRAGALFMDMGTGKSRTLLELARLRQGKWDKLFWFTPCSLRENVREQILIHTDVPPDRISIWDQRTLKAGPPKSSLVHIVGIESMGQSDRCVLAYNREVGPDSFVAVDESDYIKGNRAKRSQRLTHMSAKCRYRAILTGTALSQGAVDLYSQMAFLSPKILGYRSFWSFARNHLEYEERRDEHGRKRKTGRIIASHNEDYLAAKIAPYAYRVSKDECLSLPKKLYEDRYFYMTAQQRELYERAKDEILSLDYDDWSPIKIFHLFTSLQTIICGFWRSPSGEVVTIPHRRIDLLQQTISEIPEGEKIIIWAKYRPAVEEICAALNTAHGEGATVPYYGPMNERQRSDALCRWRAEARFLVATQSTGGRGLTLNEAATTIFYADGFKYSERLQSEDRNHRIGQMRRPLNITLRCAESIDTNIKKSGERKGSYLDQFQSKIDEYKKLRMKDMAIELVRSL